MTQIESAANTGHSKRKNTMRYINLLLLILSPISLRAQTLTPDPTGWKTVATATATYQSTPSVTLAVGTAVSYTHLVRVADIKMPEFSETAADDFLLGDLRDPGFVREAIDGMERVYQLAADMGGAGYLFTGDNDADVMHNSAMINLNVLEAGVQAGVKRFFYSSSACVYPEHNQLDPDNPNCCLLYTSTTLWRV